MIAYGLDSAKGRDILGKHPGEFQMQSFQAALPQWSDGQHEGLLVATCENMKSTADQGGSPAPWCPECLLGVGHKNAVSSPLVRTDTT